MREINIYLAKGSHTIYNELINYPPKNIFYKSSFLENTQIYHSNITNIRRELFTRFLNLFKLPRIVYINSAGCDLIHSCRGVLILNRKPWVVDFEHAGSFVGNQIEKLKQQRYKKIIKKFLISKFCKKIMPWSIAAYQTLDNCMGIPQFKNKVQVVYPAMHLPPLPKRKKNGTIRLLFVGHCFLAKGGKDLLTAFEFLRRRYDIELTMITNLPNEFKKYQGLKDLDIKPANIPREILFNEYYSNADIFVLPSYVDSFGFALLEAMSFSLPVVATNIFAIPEIVEDQKSGFLIEAPTYIKNNFLPTDWVGGEKYEKYIRLKHPNVVKQLIEKLSLLVESSNLRKVMGRRGRKEIEKGKLSIKRRSEQLRKIYEEALRS